MILITGATGFIGSSLSDFLLAKRYKVRRTARTSIGKSYFKLDLENSSDIKNSCKNINTIFHLAALDFAESEKNYQKSRKINFMATKNLYQAALDCGVNNFIYFSTAHVYGKNLINHVTEETIPIPISNYAKTHYMSESYLLNRISKDKANIIIFRLSNIIGKTGSINKDKWKYVANDLCFQALKNKEIILKTDGSQKRDFYSIENLLVTLENLILKKNELMPNGLFNIGGEETISIMQLAEIIKRECKLMYNLNVKITNSDKKDQVHNLYYDISKIKNENIYNKDYTIRDSVVDTLNFCKKYL